MLIPCKSPLTCPISPLWFTQQDFGSLFDLLSAMPFRKGAEGDSLSTTSQGLIYISLSNKKHSQAK
jgi:hypothetical protein